MAIDLSNRTRRALSELSIEPNLIVQIEGISTLFSAVPVRDFIEYGCPDIFYGGDDVFYGGLKDVEDNKDYIDSGTTTFSIRQQMNYDEGNASSISSMTIGLVDKNQEISRLISPGFEIEDILGRKVRVYQQFGDTSFFEDAILVFRGFVTKIDSQPGLVKLKLNHPDNKKQVSLFKSVETRLTAGINASQTTIPVEDASTFFDGQGPLNAYIRIGTEIMSYTSRTGTTFDGATRGSLGSTAQPHSSGAQVRALYCLEGSPFDLALQIMMSGHGTDPIFEDIPVTKFVQVGAGSGEVADAIWFEGVRIIENYGLRVGDTITITGATNGANNIVNQTVTDIVQFESGFYIVVDGAGLVLETTTSAVMATFTQFNTLPDGMRMTPDEVDVDEHILVRDRFFSSTEFRIYIKEDEIEGKEFIDLQLYQPISCYALPRKAASSVGYTVGPIPGEDIVTLDNTNIRDPKNIVLTRTTNRSFFNEVVYKYDDDPLNEEERFLSGSIIISQTSKNRIPGTTKTLSISSLGLRTDLNAANLVALNAQRQIDRYEFGAEQVTVKTLLRNSAGLEIGDVVVGALEALQVTDITRGDRQFESRLFEIQNKTINLKSGLVDLVLLDTGLNIDTRFGLMSPVSRIKGVVSQSVFIIGPDDFYGGKFGQDEFRKWESLVRANRRVSIVMTDDERTFTEDAVLRAVDGNQLTLVDPLVTPIVEGYRIEFSGYVDVDTTDDQKLVYGYMTDDPNFPDGGNPYGMI